MSSIEYVLCIRNDREAKRGSVYKLLDRRICSCGQGIGLVRIEIQAKPHALRHGLCWQLNEFTRHESGWFGARGFIPINKPDPDLADESLFKPTPIEELTA